MKATQQQVKMLNQILGKEDVITRFRLLQLWMIDIFTESLGDINAKPIVELMTTSNISKSDNAETIYNAMNSVKRNLMSINDQLVQIYKQLEHQKYINTLLCKIFDEEGVEDEGLKNDEHSSAGSEAKQLENRMDKLYLQIDRNQHRINTLQALSESKINELIADEKPTTSSSNEGA